jgi:autotransporter-associated beta strand protein
MVWLIALVARSAVPEPPVSVTIRPVSNREIKLMWFDSTDGDGVTRYRIQRKINDSTDPMQTVIDTAANATQFTDSGLAGDTTYQYRIQSLNTNGVSAWVWTQHTTEQDPVAAPQAVRLITAAAVSSGTVNVWWVDVDHTEELYRLQRDANDDNWADIAVLGRNATVYTDRDRQPGQTYRYRVRAENAIGAAEYIISDPVIMPSAPAGAPAAPASATAAVLGDTQIEVIWSEVSGEDGYAIERKVGTGDYAPLRTVRGGVTQIMDKGLADAETHRYRVRAFNSAGTSDWVETAAVGTTTGGLPLFNVEPNLQYGPDGLRDWGQVDIKIEQLLDNQGDWQTVIDATDEFSLNTTVTRTMSYANKVRMIQFMNDNGMTYMLGTGGLRFIDTGPRMGLGVRNAVTDWSATIQPYLALGGTIKSILMDTPFNHVIRGGRYDTNGLDSMDFSISEAAYELAAYMDELRSYPGLENVRFILCENSGRWSFTDEWPGIDPAMSAGDDGLLYAFDELNRACGHFGVEIAAFCPDANTSYIDGFGPEGFGYDKLRAIESHVRRYGWDFEKFYNGNSNVDGGSDRDYHEQVLDLYRKMHAAGVVVDVVRCISFTGRPLALLPEDADYTLMNNAKVLHQAILSTEQGLYTWSGKGDGTYWSDGFNWEGTLAPAGGTNSTLRFDDAADLTTTNDLPAGTAFQSITLGTGLTGNVVFAGSALRPGDSGAATRIIDMEAGIAASSVTFDLDIEIFEGIGNFICRVPTRFNGRLSRAPGINANTNHWHDFSGGGVVTLANEANDFDRALSVSGSATVRTHRLANALQPGPAGAGTFIKLGNAGSRGTLEYTGAAAATDRQLRIGGGENNVGFTGGAALLNNGSGAIDFTASDFTIRMVNTTAPRTLELGGSYAGEAANRIRGTIADHDTAKGGIVNVKITGSSWRLSGTNTYTGSTSVEAGALSGGHFSGDLTVRSNGVLRFSIDGAGAFTSISGRDTLTLADGAAIELNFDDFAPGEPAVLQLFSGWADLSADPDQVDVAITGLDPAYLAETASLFTDGTVTVRARAASPIEIGSSAQVVDAETGERFFPVGFNYAPLDAGGHAVFNPESYDGAVVEADLQRIADYGFTVVRVFINAANDHPSGVGYNTTAAEPLNPDYLDNVADFLQRAASVGLLIQPSMTHFPRNDKYNAIINSYSEPAQVGGMNVHYLHPGFIAAKEAYLEDFWTAIRDRFPDVQAALFNVDLGNELNFHVDEPFTLESGTFEAANGQSYDLAADRIALADDMAVYWLNRMAASVRSVLPTTLINANVFTYHAVKRSGPGDFAVTGVAWKDRFPFRPLAMAQSEVDLIDIHLYGNGMEHTTADLTSIEWADTYAVGVANNKAFLVGEFGAMHANFPADQPEAARQFILAMADRILDEGFTGWMLWSYNGAAFNHHWAIDRTFAILEALSRVSPGHVLPDSDFDTDGDAEGWFGESVTGLNVSGGSLNGSGGTDVALVHDQLSFSGNAYVNIVFSLVNHPEGSVRFQWMHSDDPAFNPVTRELLLPLHAAGQTTRVTALADHPEWKGRRITGLRILPAGEANTDVSLHWVRASTGDLDGDGIPDLVEFEEGYDAADASDAEIDFDEDGYTRLEEYLWGTSDRDVRDRFSAQIDPVQNGTVLLRWNGLAGRIYRIWKTPELVDPDWILLNDSGVLEGDQMIEIPDSNAGQQGFYKIRVNMP